MEPFKRTNNRIASDGTADSPPRSKQQQEDGLLDMIRLSVTSFAARTSVHGWSWYNQTDNRSVRALVTAVGFLFIILVPIMLGVRMVLFVQQPRSVMTAIESFSDNTILYPNITICNPKFFDINRIIALNTSHPNMIASYLTMALDPGARTALAKKFGEDGQHIVYEKFNAVEAEFLQILERNNLTVQGLFEKVSLRCEDFVIYCELHRDQLMGKVPRKVLNVSGPTCCQHMFDKKPIFTYSGTCYTSRIPIEETRASIFSSIQIWNVAHQEKAPMFDLLVQGSESCLRSGFHFALTTTDHPAAELSSASNRVPFGFVTSIGLEKKEIDLRRLATKEKCATTKESEVFLKKFGIPLTKKNCQFVRYIYTVKNCSIAHLQGIVQKDLPPCSPRETLFGTLTTPYDILDRDSEEDMIIYELFKGNCTNECMRQEFTIFETLGQVDPVPLQILLQRFNISVSNNISVIQLYFRTLNIERRTLYQETLLDFLSKVGGWLGLAIGASIFSFIEIMAFIFVLVKQIIQTLIKLMRKNKE